MKSVQSNAESNLSGPRVPGGDAWTHLLVLSLLLAIPAIAGAQKRQAWLTGAGLQRQREQPTTVNWSGVAIRDGLAKVSNVEQVAVLLDRRIDPGRPIDLIAEQVKLGDLLMLIADKADADVSWLGPLAYVGPHQAARRLRTLAALRAADVRKLSASQRTAFQRSAPLRWDELAEPRIVISQLADEVNAIIDGLDLVPHDLWPAADLSPLSWTDRLTLIANEFDLTFQFRGDSQLRLMPITEPVVIERTYPVAKQAAELAARWKRLVPDAEIELEAGKLIVRGRLEDHELLRPTKPIPADVARPGVQVYSLTIREQPLRAVLDKLRESSIKLSVDENALEKAKLTLDCNVSFAVERATLEKLLEAALKPAGLTFRKMGDVYQIVPAEGAK